MKISRRAALAAMAATTAFRRASAQGSVPAIEKGPFQGSRESLQAYQIPDWFRDAKFGIWAHWGPQSAPEDGDWYARNMYMEGSPQYKFHVNRYGHPSKFGFKDVIGTWKGDRFDADYLVGLYKKAGAKYFVSMGVHHDNFDMWNSKYQPRWNATKMGPKKDIVGLFSAAARKNGLKFGVSEHLWISYKWFAVNHGADKAGALAGVPYDGIDRENADLYHDYTGVDYKKFIAKLDWDDSEIPDRWKLHWFNRMKDLVDSYHPDLLYTDGAMPFEDYGCNLVAHLYNSSVRNGGRAQAVYNSKRKEDCASGTCVLDVERGVVDGVWPTSWQTDTCVGDWHYKKNVKYKSTKTVVDMLVDIVSRNGNLLLNFPLPNSGMLDANELAIVAEITEWMNVNSEGIYSTRPWKVFGEGPSATIVKTETAFNEKNRSELTAEDVRFTTKGRVLYAFVMGWPEKQAVIKSLAQGSADKIANVELLGHHGRIQWTQGQSGLNVNLPNEKPSKHAVTLKVTWA